MVSKELLEKAIHGTFGKVLADQMMIAKFENGSWQEPELVPLGPLPLSPASHVLHYSSTCFEGLKAHRWPDGDVHIFRLNDHMKRFEQSAKQLCLPQVGIERASNMVRTIVKACRDWVPEPPGALYIRPTLIGTDESIGSATKPSQNALFYILVSPVGDYFNTNQRTLKILVETKQLRTSPHFGAVKTGGNYAACLKKIMDSNAAYGADNVLFAPGGDIQETGAANFLLIDDKRIVTKDLDGSFLPGITRNSILSIAKSMGYEVEERPIKVSELDQWLEHGEAVLSGTAAVLSPVGTLIIDGETKSFKKQPFVHAPKLRQALVDVQRGLREDPNHWTEKV